MRIAVLLGAFPVISETFIVRQINALIDLGHQVTVYAQFAPPVAIIQPEVRRNHLLDHVVYLQLTGGHASLLARVRTVVSRLPVLPRALASAPRMTVRALNPAVYGYANQPISAPLR